MVRTSEDPLPQENAASPLERGTKLGTPGEVFSRLQSPMPSDGLAATRDGALSGMSVPARLGYYCENSALSLPGSLLAKIPMDFDRR